MDHCSQKKWISSWLSRLGQIHRTSVPQKFSIVKGTNEGYFSISPTSGHYSKQHHSALHSTTFCTALNTPHLVTTVSPVDIAAAGSPIVFDSESTCICLRWVGGRGGGGGCAYQYTLWVSHPEFPDVNLEFELHSTPISGSHIHVDFCLLSIQHTSGFDMSMILSHHWLHRLFRCLLTSSGHHLSASHHLH